MRWKKFDQNILVRRRRTRGLGFKPNCKRNIRIFNNAQPKEVEQKIILN